MNPKHSARSFRDHSEPQAYIWHCEPCGHTKVGFTSREDADEAATLHNETGAVAVVVTEAGTPLAVGTLDAPVMAQAPKSKPEHSKIQPPARVPAKLDPLQRKAIREWAEKSGLKCPTRGAIPGAIIERYNTAGGKPLRKRPGSSLARKTAN